MGQSEMPSYRGTYITLIVVYIYTTMNIKKYRIEAMWSPDMRIGRSSAGWGDRGPPLDRRLCLGRGRTLYAHKRGGRSTTTGSDDGRQKVSAKEECDGMGWTVPERRKIKRCENIEHNRMQLRAAAH